MNFFDPVSAARSLHELAEKHTKDLEGSQEIQRVLESTVSSIRSRLEGLGKFSVSCHWSSMFSPPNEQERTETRPCQKSKLLYGARQLRCELSVLTPRRQRQRSRLCGDSKSSGIPFNA